MIERSVIIARTFSFLWASLLVAAHLGPAGMLVLGLLVILGVVAGMVAATILGMRYAVAIPALMLENLKARDAIGRSAALIKGHTWRVLLIIILMYILSLVAAAIFQGPFYVAILVVAARHHVGPFWLQAPMTISGGVGGALSGPLLMIALALLYYDTRVRKEGFDLQLTLDSLGERAPDATLRPEPAEPSPAPSS